MYLIISHPWPWSTVLFSNLYRLIAQSPHRWPTPYLLPLTVPFYPRFTPLSSSVIFSQHFPSLFSLPPFNLPFSPTFYPSFFSHSLPFPIPPLSPIKGLTLIQGYIHLGATAQICNTPIPIYVYDNWIYQLRKKSNIRYYKIHDICIEEVKLTNDFSKETII